MIPFMETPKSRELPVVVEQLVPSRVCFACDVCCRFPEQDSALRPYFTREEIQSAIARGVSPDAFPDQAGSKIAVVPHGEEGYRCPAFDPQTGHCGIYEDRPLDCRLYPVAVMWDQACSAVVMGWDSKCPFIRDNLDSPESQAYVERTSAILESQESVKVFVSNKQLIGSFQDDVIVLKRLDCLTRTLHSSTLPPAR
ncbi:MAG: YkgJ family cysteine cluster protein [Nitrospiraceae bacterium]|nr:MAG: YkgJ family cysteine cluster protein [Nitrospiraceae bacterium]